MNLSITLILSLVLWLSAPGSVKTASGQGQMTNTIMVLRGGGNGQCSSMEERERARSDIRQIAIQSVSEYRFTCNGTPGWRRVAFINMTDTSYNCPAGLNLTSYSKRTCGRSHIIPRCSSTTFSVGGLPYSQVCGRIRGYQFGSTGAFDLSQGIDSYYVHGVSLTHGRAGNRQHIWTFAAGLSEVHAYPRLGGCPCDAAARSSPAFVGNDYFCESGLHSEWNAGYYGVLFSDDVLWDGQDCTSNSTCCRFNNPPWFTKNLRTATTNDIELRICVYNPPSAAEVPLELIELYLQ